MNSNRPVDLRDAFSLSEEALLSGIARTLADGAHSIFAPSSSKRWLSCPGSLIPSALSPDDSGIDAAYGTVGHAIAEEWLITGVDPSERLIGQEQYVQAGEWGYLIPIDSEMIAYVREYVDSCNMLAGDHHVEVKSDFSRWMPIPHQRGTSDHVALSEGLCVVTDLKLGSNVYVSAEFNSQLMIYALGVYDRWGAEYGITRFILRIFQPRMNNYSQWEISVDDLLAFGEFVRERAALAWSLDAPRVPSIEACRYCPVADSCAANAVFQVRLMSKYPFDLGDPIGAAQYAELREFLANAVDDWRAGFADPAELSTDELARVNLMAPLANSFWKKVDAQIVSRKAAGESIPFHKIVIGKSKRFFNNPEKVEKVLAPHMEVSTIWTRTLISPAKAEAALKKAGLPSSEIKDIVDPLIKKIPGRDILVPDTDPRRSKGDDLASAFDD